jgi:hypothetical protein
MVWGGGRGWLGGRRTPATLKGDAQVNGAGGYKFTLDVVDNGEPGGGDTYRLRLTQPGNPAYGFDTQGPLSGGNIKVQAYP